MTLPIRKISLDAYHGFDVHSLAGSSLNTVSIFALLWKYSLGIFVTLYIYIYICKTGVFDILLFSKCIENIST